MSIQLQSLKLKCKHCTEVLDFSPGVTFLHGKISAGKSTVLRLVDYCLGGDLERTPAIAQEMVSAELSVRVGSHDAVFERNLGANQVMVTWRDSDQNGKQVLAPIDAVKDSPPIWSMDVYNLSDLVFHLLGLTPIKVRRSKHDSESALVRLSLRDYMWYCYLEQDHLDSSFFRLEDPFRGLKSRDVMRFTMGYYTETLNELEIKLDRLQRDRETKEATAQQIADFQVRFGFGTENELRAEVASTELSLSEAKAQLLELRAGSRPDSHVGDELRKQLRALTTDIAAYEESLAEISSKMGEHQSLRAELLSTKFKLARAAVASQVLAGVTFSTCPACGRKLQPRAASQEECPLCGGNRPELGIDELPSVDPGADIDTRIAELDDSITRLKKASSENRRNYEARVRQKQALDSELSETLRDYDSAFLSQAREYDRKCAALQERLANLQRLQQVPAGISQLRIEAAKLRVEESATKDQIRTEFGKLSAADDNIRELEDTYLQILVQVGVPGVQAGDLVSISRRTWRPSIFAGGNEDLGWTFYDAGSGGKKTLLNVCYALAIHCVASKRGLPMPSILMIDTPMKNISEDVNRDIFAGFYDVLYRLALTVLDGTQMIVVDKEYAEPPPNLDAVERYMTPDDPNHPPLIRCYHGA